MEELGIPFTVVSKEVAELTRATPGETVAYNAGLKADTLAETLASGRLVLAADTVLALGGEIFGKPRNAGEAKAFLAAFSGKSVQAHTGVALVHKENNVSLLSLESAEIVFRRLSPEMIDWYLDTGEPLSRAGAFAVSGMGELLVDAIRGSHSCIAGLPKYSTLLLLRECFARIGVGVPVNFLFPAFSKVSVRNRPAAGWDMSN